ncbi:hypothetical protein ACFQFS_14340 [Novosphingobium lubricantis]
MAEAVGAGIETVFAISARLKAKAAAAVVMRWVMAVIGVVLMKSVGALRLMQQALQEPCQTGKTAQSSHSASGAAFMPQKALLQFGNLPQRLGYHL